MPSARAPGDDPEALVSASVRRQRPFAMTTGIGLLPLIIARDEAFYGLASVVAFGLVVGTVLSLGVVPTLYSLVMRIPGRPREVDDATA